MKRFRSFFQRMYVPYFLILAIFFGLLHGKEVISRVNLQTLNRIKPESFQTLREAMDGQAPISSQDLKEYTFYYDKAAEYVSPISDDILGMQAYCAFLAGNNEQAKIYLEKAEEINPYYFWYPYSLGILALKQGELPKAGEYFKRAQKNANEKTIVAAAYSLRIYMPIAYVGQEDMVPWLGVRLNHGFHQNNVLLLYVIFQINRDREQYASNPFFNEADKLTEADINRLKIQVF